MFKYNGVLFKRIRVDTSDCTGCFFYDNRILSNCIDVTGCCGKVPNEVYIMEIYDYNRKILNKNILTL